MKKPKDQKFLDRYHGLRRLFAGDKLGRSAIWHGTDAAGRSVLIRQWPRQHKQQDEELEDIWRSEIRQLHSLAALPAAGELITRLLSTGKDGEGFYLVLEAGDASPLQTLLDASRRNNMLVSHRMPQVRALLWRNFRRLIEGVELLHSQGTLHRNIDPWSVMTDFSSDPDFRLTGFEWSMRIAKTAEPLKKGSVRPAPRTRATSSFLGDWNDLALLIATVLEIPAAKLADLRLPPSAVTDHTTAAEVRLLRTMLGLIPVDRLDSDELLRQLDAIITTSVADASRKDAQLHLALSLGHNSKLTDKIRAATGRSIDVSDISKQIDFIASDLGDAPLLVCCQPEYGAVNYQLCGGLLNYKIRPWKQPNSTEAETWEFARCEDADTDPPSHLTVRASKAIDLASLDFISRVDARESFPRLRGRTLSWQAELKALEATSAKKTEEQQTYQAIVLLFLIELAYSAADIFPVRVMTDANAAQRGDTFRIHVKSERDEPRQKLSDALKLHSPARRLSQILDSGDLREENAWMLLERGELGETVQMTQWRLVDPERDENAGAFELEGTKPPQIDGSAYLAKAQAGTIVQLKRRLRALVELGRHTELLKMLNDPRGGIDDSQDKLDMKDDEFANLDKSKQKALERIFATVPLFLVQGPPGVGKTYVVSEIVRRRLEDEATSRFLLTAQSNAAIDHLMDEIRPLFRNSDNPPMIVRARSIEDDRKAQGVETEHVAAKIVKELAASPLVKEGTPTVQERVQALALEYGGQQGNGKAKKRARTSSDKRAIESMILRSANLVFATTNSAAVETLILDRGLFDWTIVEEAGKATGSELISPLLLSHRRLMIGDHKQLPPFDSERVEKLLADPEAVKSVLKAGEELISRQLKDALLEELLSDVQQESSDFPAICALALRFLKMFGSFVEEDYAFQEKHSSARPIAQKLLEQHRMHPAIAKIVSECFYEGTLKNYEKKEREFLTSDSPVVLKIGNQRAPISVIDMPYSRKKVEHAAFADAAPNWRNDKEVDAALQVLKELEARPGNDGKKPSLAVLSPYAEQVRRLKTAISAAIDAGELDLSAFAPAVGGSEFVGTVDSFQGDQADCVVISLVRNNEHTNPDKALGFLTKSHRMNVLLSRAKWKMVLIGSREFYEYVLSNGELPDVDLSFFRKFYAAVTETPKESVETITYMSLGELK
ncbi:AAA domain-containing protein [Rhizobium sp. WSM1274]|uniref:AAA domain-containing protein n=1 Tax=Rhizobium sp. WSM1274 TaxID=3138254 RepID=UPI0021A2C7D4|nr:AAA domain-containing protein [Rhizobium leguminosarum]UWU27283.1 AAA domain-containing protein [Rhizobium leguminosarum bv. viciae]